ncbi:glycosyl hydrolase family protein [Agromyces tardus]|uniref:Glycosyl hydrolase family protein n=1 Tax=Agromyces tardus TaxID=2583849 RepID=A0A3M8AKI1_9MICO|nr:family 1 glycosylhydrolase [Agromyces tardus]RNB51127.1 glycosyl hydrolase family protein [Agromyces tardus]
MASAQWTNDGRLHFGVGIEDTFIPQEALGHRKLDEYELTQHYQNWRSDLDHVADSGAELLRWGIPWYLVEPRPGEFDWRWLDEVAAHMNDRGIRCVVDLMHYGTPLWLENSFANAAYPERVASYARAVAERYAGVWDDFTPLNEPVINAIYCGETGVWPPNLQGQDGFVRVAVALARGLVRTQQEIEAVNPAATFVHVEAGFRWEGDTTPLSRELLEERRFIILDLAMGRVGEKHPLRSYLAEHGVTGADLDWFAHNPVTPDVLGVNYYPGFTTVSMDDSGTTQPVEAGTAGLRDLVEVYSERYGLPLAITETSRGGSVEARLEWLEESLTEVNALREEGHPVLAYIWFPFFTLVDWLYRLDHHTPDHWFVHMGLIDLVRGADQQLQRHHTPAFDAFRSHATASK